MEPVQNVLSYFINLTFGAIHPKSNIYIVEGQGFIAYVETPREFGEIKKCTVQFETDKSPHEIDLKLATDKHIESPRGEILSRYSTSKCGVRVMKVSTASQGKWKLEVQSESDKKIVEQLRITVLENSKSNIVTRVKKNAGRDTLSCKKHKTTRSCRIRSKTNEITEECSLYTVLREPSEWYCSTLNWGDVEESTETIHVDIEKSDKSAVATLEETDKYLVLRCQLPYKRISGCRAEYPDKKRQLYIGEGLNNGRYTTLDTSWDNGLCVLEIKKPLGNEEKGIWTFYEAETKSLRGCMFFIGEDKQNLIKEAIKQLEDVATIETIESEDENTLEIKCKVPFPLDRCYLRDPANNVYFQNELEFMSTKTLGICIFKQLLTIPGRWICGLSGPDHENEVIQEFEIVVKSKMGEALTEQVTAAAGESIELVCKSALSEPISECAFIDPQGNVHLVSNSFKTKSSSRISYFGQGLEAGQCGIKIKNLNQNDFGEWSCQFTSQYLKPSFKIAVQEQSLGQATIIGVSAGAAVLFVVIVIGATYMFIRKRRARIEIQRSTDNISMSSREERSVL